MPMKQPILSMVVGNCLLQRKAGRDCVGVMDVDAPLQINDNEIVEFTLSRSVSPSIVSKYKTQLPDKKLLQQKLHELFKQRRRQECRFLGYIKANYFFCWHYFLSNYLLVLNRLDSLVAFSKAAVNCNFMKHYLSILFLLTLSTCFAQTKLDTLFTQFQQADLTVVITVKNSIVNYERSYSGIN